jgi:hypothetical protein
MAKWCMVLIQYVTKWYSYKTVHVRERYIVTNCTL